MNNTPAHKALRDYQVAHRDIELAGLAIDILNKLNDKAGNECVKKLLASQQRSLRKMDSAAAKLVAPVEFHPQPSGD